MIIYDNCMIIVYTYDMPNVPERHQSPWRYL